MSRQVIDPANIRMSYLACELDFLFEAGNHFLIRGDFGKQSLERDPHSKLEAFSFVHLAHATSGDKPDDLISAAEHSSRSEAHCTFRGGGRGYSCVTG